MNLGEIFKIAGMNTLLGMGTVFCVLIFISFIISLFKYIAPQAKAQPAPAPAPAPVAEVKEEEEDQGLLVAVITAALYASMEAQGQNPEGYVVRRIRRN